MRHGLLKHQRPTTACPSPSAMLLGSVACRHHPLKFCSSVSARQMFVLVSAFFSLFAVLSPQAEISTWLHWCSLDLNWNYFVRGLTFPPRFSCRILQGKLPGSYRWNRTTENGTQNSVISFYRNNNAQSAISVQTWRSTYGTRFSFWLKKKKKFEFRILRLWLWFMEFQIVCSWRPRFFTADLWLCVSKITGTSTTHPK